MVVDLPDQETQVIVSISTRPTVLPQLGPAALLGRSHDADPRVYESSQNSRGAPEHLSADMDL